MYITSFFLPYFLFWDWVSCISAWPWHCYVAENDFELLICCHLFWGPGIIGMSHHVWLYFYLCIFLMFLHMLYFSKCRCKSQKYNNTYMFGPKETALVITIPRMIAVKTVEMKEICKKETWRHRQYKMQTICLKSYILFINWVNLFIDCFYHAP